MGIGTTTPTKAFDARGEGRVWNGANGCELSYSTSNTSAIYGSANTSGNIEFRTDTGATAKMFITNAGSIGIGTTSPLDLVHIKSSSNDARILLDGHTNFDAELKFAENGTVKYTIGNDSATDNFVIGTANVDNPLVNINSSGTINIPDNGHLTFGGSSDLHIYHDGANSYIDETGQGDLIIKGSDDVYIFAGSDIAINCNDNSEVSLWYNNVKKAETTADGFKCTGALRLTEISTPTATADHGKIYTKSDNKLYFQDGAGTEHEIAFV